MTTAKRMLFFMTAASWILSTSAATTAAGTTTVTTAAVATTAAAKITAASTEGQECKSHDSCGKGMWCGSQCKTQFDLVGCDPSQWNSDWEGDVCQSSAKQPCISRVSADKFCPVHFSAAAVFTPLSQAGAVTIVIITSVFLDI